MAEFNIDQFTDSDDDGSLGNAIIRTNNNAENDYVEGDGGNDSISGSAGNDNIYGEDGDHVLDGGIFSALVRGETLTSQQLGSLKAEDDTAMIPFNGREIQIEQNNTVIIYDDFSDVSDFQLNGTAVQVDNIIRLAPRTLGYTAGSTFLINPLTFTEDTSFQTQFQFQIANPTGVGADGLAFVLHNDTRGASALGALGGWLGYAGSGAITRSVAVEFDIYNNGTSFGDPNHNHIGLDQNGSIVSIQTATPSINFESGVPVNVWVDYDGITDRLEVFLDNSSTQPAIPLLSRTINIFDIVGSQAFVGFSAGTGGATADFNLLNFDFNSSTPNTPPTSSNNTLIIPEDTDRIFATADFNFNDPDPSDTLQELRIDSLPVEGTLYLDSNSNSIIDTGEEIDVDRRISVVDINAEQFKFKPDADENGTPYSSFNFSVSDGIDFSVDSATMTLDVIDVPDPDLLVETISIIPTDASFGDTVEVSWVVRNVGDDPATEGWSDRIYLSSDTVIDANDIQLITVAATAVPLAAENTYTQTASVELPIDLSLNEGTYYILAETDALGEQYETAETNNVNSTAIDIQANFADLSTWEQQGLLSAGNWTVSGDHHQFVKQLINGQPTFFVSPFNFINGQVTGTFKVETPSDDDYIGFVFGYQSPIRDLGDANTDYEFLLLDWKQNNQSPGREGFVLSRVTGAGADLFGHSPSSSLELLGTIYDTTRGWRDNTEYEFELTYTNESILINIDGTTIFDVEGSFEAGRFGFYNYSQSDVRYGNFRGTGLTGTEPVAEDDTYQTDEDVTLIVTAIEGVLANDTNPSLGTLTVDQLVDDVSFGTLTLNDDGSFTYIPAPNFAGTDSFTYLSTDGTTPSGLGTVTLTVNNIDNDPPADIQLTNTNVEENSPDGEEIGQLSAIDPDPDETHAFILTNDAGGRFHITGDRLEVADGSLLDAETDSSHDITIEVQDDEGLSFEKSFTININDINEAPTAIDISQTTVEENSPNGTFIGILTADDPDVSDSLTFSLVDDAEGRFAIDEDKLIVADGSRLDFEAEPTHSITIRAEDAGGLTYDRTLEISLSNIFEPGILAFNSPNYLVNPEGIGEAEITIIRTEGTEGEVSITVNSANGMAIAPEDFDNTPIIVTFAEGETEKTIFIPIEDENLYEADESFTITLIEPQGGAILGTQHTATVTIINDDFPNLQVSSITPPVEAWSGQPIEINWTVLNNSLATTQGTWLDRLYLSDDDQFGNDIFLGELASPVNLDGGESYQRSHIFNLPNGISGDYQIIVVTDAGDTIAEADESDNTNFSSIFPLLLSPYADLQVTSVNVPTTAKAGEQATFNWTVTNAGTGATDASAWYDRLYLSSDTTLGSGDIYLGQAVNPSYLAENESYAQSLSVNLPNSLEGQYYAIVNTDATNRQYEVDFEDNNTGTSLATVTVEAPPPPGFLQVIDVSISPSTGTIWSGQAVTVTWTVENTGDTIIPVNPNYGFWDDGLALSPTPSWDGINGIWLGGHQGYRREALDVNESYTHQKTITLPQYLSGEWHIVAVPDTHYIAGATGGIGSSNIPRDLGAAAIEITLPPQPDLQVTQVDVEDEGNSGQPISVSWTVSNEGFGTTAGTRWTDKVYLSADNTLQGSDTLLGTFTHYGRLESVTDYTRTESVTLPQNIEGDYYLIVRTDTGNAIYEYDDNYDAEGNNINYDPIPITVTIVPSPQVDLQVREIESLNPAFSGRTLDIRWTVTNEGEDDLTSSQWQDRLILSADDNLATSNDNFFLATVDQSRDLAAGDSYQQTQTVLPPVGISGNYHLFLTTDSNNQVIEPNAEDNNNASIVLAITLPPAPDLEITELNHTEAWSGQELEVNWSVTNSGAGDTRPQETSWLDSLYLSEDDSLDSSDRLLTEILHDGSLTAGDAYAVTTKVTLDLGLAGDYHLILITDGNDQVYEGDGEANNQMIVPLTVNLSPQPDLVVTDINTTPALSGQELQVNWTITNTGQGDTRIQETSWLDSLYLSEDDSLDSSDRLLTEILHEGSLTAGDDYSVSTEITLDVGLEGDYHLILITDRQERVYESGGEANNQTVIPLTVNLSPQPDLEVTNINTTPAWSGQELEVTWTVTNIGQGDTRDGEIPWLDKLYLSEDGGDRLYSQISHNTVLNSGDSYDATANVTLPIGIEGDYTLFVITDTGNVVYEKGGEDNNQTAIALPITLSPPPDLQVSQVDAPTTAYASQPMTINWTVTNEGEGITQSNSWYDSVYLSRDQFLDGNADIFLGSVKHQGEVDSDSNYSTSITATLPPGISGPYYAFVVTDSTEKVFEAGADGNNTHFDGNATVIEIPPPADLQVTDISVPATGITGESPPELITWTVTNSGDAPAVGTWYDAVYLSADESWDLGDALIATVRHTGDIVSQASYTVSTNAILPGAIPGDYQVIVRSDIRNQVRETDDSNNSLASEETINLDMAQLTYDATTTANIANGSDRYYRLDTEAGQDILLTADFNNPAQAEIYVRYGETPNRAEFDAVYSDPYELQQEIALSNTREGSYYILVYGREGAGSNSSFDLTPEVLDFGVRSLSLSEGSNQGQVTISLKGAKFTPETEISLISTDGDKNSAQEAWWRSNSEMWATFDLQGLDLGLYDVQVTDGEINATLEDSFTVTAGAVGSLDMEIIAPSAIRPGYQGTVTIEYENMGETDIVAPILALDADNARLRFVNGENWTEGQVYFLGINPEGPAGILSPGAKGSVSLVFDPLNTTDSIFFQLTTPQETNTIDWEALKDQAKPATVGEEAWDVVWQEFSTSVGDTVDDYQNVLAENATYLSQLGESSHDVSRLLRFEMLQSSNYGSQFQNYNLGSLGYGWSFPWDIKLATDTEGNVTLYGAGFFRSFEKQADGSYEGQPGDYATLTEEGNTYRLEETDGLVSVFNAEGKLSYLEDSNNNRLTAVYTGDELTQLLHSNGDSFEFSYNNFGRIGQITDPAGRITTYSYEEPTGHLLSVTSPDGTTSYTYNNDHSISSITYPDNSQVFYTYDSQGRLIEESYTGDEETVTYEYDSTSGVTVTDATGANTQLYFNDRGQLAQAYDALGRTISLEYDASGNLTGLISPNGSNSSFNYDEQGNLLNATDALGQTVYFTYDSTADALKTVRDQKGNVTQYSYDSRDNLTAITYADSSEETFSYDDTGNPIASVNRRSEPITYTYNNRGQLLRKDYGDGSLAEYTYDDRGNLLTATNEAGIISFEYDSVDRLTKTTDTTGRYVTFTYDSGGRRSEMATSDGLTVNYIYDEVGRLAGLTDTNDSSIVTYTYNTAGYLIQEDNGNGTRTTYDYDSAGQLLSIINYDGDSINSRYDYTYDQLGRRTSLTTLEGTTEYGYDAISQLTSVTLPDDRLIEYQYDAAGNRIAVTDDGEITSYIANNLNQYTSVDGVTYSYDLDGNLMAKGNDVTYTYNTENRLIGVENADGVWTYEYDALGNRIASIHNDVRTEYLLDPTGLVDVIGEYSDNGDLVAHYVHGLGLVSRVDNTQVNYYDADAIGSIIGLTGADGEYVNRYQYLPFGEDLSKTETVSNPFEYVGEWGVMDESNGLDFMRARFYTSDEGRFLNVDSAGQAVGLNLYVYVGNNSVNFVDISGKGKKKVIKFLDLTKRVSTGEERKFLDLTKRVPTKVNTVDTTRVNTVGTKLDLNPDRALKENEFPDKNYANYANEKNPFSSITSSSQSGSAFTKLWNAVGEFYTPTDLAIDAALAVAALLEPTPAGEALLMARSGARMTKLIKFLTSPAGREILGDLARALLPDDLLNFNNLPDPISDSSISINNPPAINEDKSNLTFTVSIDGNHTTPITVKYETIDGSAIAGQDYQTVSGTLTFAPDQNELTITVPINDDSQVEDLENFQVVLSDAKGATITNGTGIGSIIDNDRLPRIEIDNSPPTTEGNPAQFTVTLLEASTSTVTVDYTTEDGTAIAGQDYQTKSGTLTFEPNETIKTIDISTIEDDQYEKEENFQITLSNASGAEISNGLGYGTIKDNDPPPLINITNTTVIEGNTAQFSVTLSEASTLPITVEYATADVTANADQDYQTKTGTLTFEPNETTKTIDILTLNDNENENIENFQVILSNASGAEITNNTATGTISDDLQQILLSIDNVSVKEDEGIATFTISLSEASNAPVTVSFYTDDSTATAGEDFTVAAGVLSFGFDPDNPEKTITEKTINVSILEDNQVEETEHFTVNLFDASGAEIANGVGYGAISDNDQLPLLNITNTTVTEGDTAQFSVTLSEVSTSPVTVDYTTTNGTAIAEQDYQTTSGKLTFAANETIQIIDIHTFDDSEVEGIENFQVILSNASGAEIGNRIGYGAISDNDRFPYLTISGGSGSESSGTGSLTVTLSESSEVEVKVDYSAIDETATFGSDYDFALENHTLTFAPGTTSQTIPIKIYDDEIDEDTETFQVILTNPQNAQIAVEKATGKIIDNDPNKKTHQPPPVDPNDIVGPAGYGDQNWINATQTLPYTIRFENKADAQAPAHTVTITHPLDDDLDWRTFRIGSFGWADIIITPENSQPFHAQRIDRTATDGYYVDISAGLNTQTGEAFWTFTTIDPETGESPIDPFLGFLPPNDENASGEGFVNYTIRPRPDASTADVIDAAATIVFDTEEPIDTPPIFNTIDAVSPQSEVTALPETTSATAFTVNWIGADDTIGSGISSYTVYVSDNGGNFNPWLTNTSNTSATYDGEEGHTYSFYTTATDNTGNTEAIPTTADATIQILSSNQPPRIITNTGLILDEGDTQAIANSYLQVTDMDNTNSELLYTLTELPERGILTVDTQILDLDGTFTQADIDNNRLTYSHDGSETLADSFNFKVSDGEGGEIEDSLFNIIVNPVNDTPVAVDDSYSVDENNILTVDMADGVLANDADVDGDELTASLDKNVSDGTLTLNPDGSFEYSPNINFNGTDSFTYTVSDGNGETDEGTVTINVSRIASLDIDGNSILELQDYNLIDLYAAQLDQEEFDFLLNNYTNDLIGEDATRTGADSILSYLNEVGDSLFDIDGNGTVELQDYNLIDLFAGGLDEFEFGFLLENFANDLIGDDATRTDVTSILDHFETIVPPLS